MSRIKILRLINSVSALFFIVSPSFRRSLFEFDAQINAKRVRHCGEVTVFVDLFLVFCILERYLKIDPSSVLLLDCRSA